VARKTGTQHSLASERGRRTSAGPSTVPDSVAAYQLLTGMADPPGMKPVAGW
jgi:hypothetical protein